MPGDYFVLDEVGLVGAGCVDWGSRGGRLAGAAEGNVAATEDGCEDAHGKLDTTKGQQSALNRIAPTVA